MALVRMPPPKPLAARLVEARGRARANGVRVEVVTPRRRYNARSVSRPGVVHTLTRRADGWTCSCEGYTYSGMCHHIGQLARRAEREGWGVEKVARPSHNQPYP